MKLLAIVLFACLFILKKEESERVKYLVFDVHVCAISQQLLHNEFVATHSGID